MVIDVKADKLKTRGCLTETLSGKRLLKRGKETSVQKVVHIPQLLLDH